MTLTLFLGHRCLESWTAFFVCLLILVHVKWTVLIYTKNIRHSITYNTIQYMISFFFNFALECESALLISLFPILFYLRSSRPRYNTSTITYLFFSPYTSLSLCSRLRFCLFFPYTSLSLCSQLHYCLFSPYTSLSLCNRLHYCLFSTYTSLSLCSRLDYCLFSPYTSLSLCSRLHYGFFSSYISLSLCSRLHYCFFSPYTSFSVQSVTLLDLFLLHFSSSFSPLECIRCTAQTKVLMVWMHSFINSQNLSLPRGWQDQQNVHEMNTSSCQTNVYST